MPDILVEGSVLRLCSESGLVSSHLRGIRHALACSGADVTKTLTRVHFGLRDGSGTVAPDLREVGRAGVGSGSRAVHIDSACLLGDFAREVVDRVEVSYFCHR